MNLGRKAPRGRFFELGKVFIRDDDAPDGALAVAGVRQPLKLGGLAFGAAEPLQWSEPAQRGVDFFDVKGDLESLFAPELVRFLPAAHPALHPGRSAAIEQHGRTIGIVGELHPRWRQAYELPASVVVFEIDAEALMQRRLPSLVPLPRLQPVWRDIAVVARKDVAHDSLVDSIVSSGEGLVRAATLFDVYEPKVPGGDIGESERSLAVRLELRSDVEPLTDARIDAAVAAVVADLERRLGVRLRKQ